MIHLVNKSKYKLNLFLLAYFYIWYTIVRLQSIIQLIKKQDCGWRLLVYKLCRVAYGRKFKHCKHHNYYEHLFVVFVVFVVVVVVVVVVAVVVVVVVVVVVTAAAAAVIVAVVVVVKVTTTMTTTLIATTPPQATPTARCTINGGSTYILDRVRLETEMARCTCAWLVPNTQHQNTAPPNTTVHTEWRMRGSVLNLQVNELQLGKMLFDPDSQHVLLKGYSTSGWTVPGEAVPWSIYG